MKDSTIFSKIDFIAAKHSISEFFHFGLFEKLAEEFESFWGDAVFGVVDEEIVPAMGQGGGAIRIFSKKFAHGRNRWGMACESFPSRKVNRDTHGIRLAETLAQVKAF
jgi:hypothetical protein